MKPIRQLQVLNCEGNFLKVFPHLISSECHNISASATKHRLQNLTPGAKYNISLAGVTRVGEGPKATVTINTLPEKLENGITLKESTLMLKKLYFSN